MSGAHHFQFWPPHSMYKLAVPATNLVYNAEVSARRYPDKPYLIFYDTAVTCSEFLGEVEHIAGYLQRHCAVRQGDRVLLYMQNCPQFVMAYYGILRADAVVVPLNPMCLPQDLLRYATDAGATTAIVSQELYSRVEPLLEGGHLKQVIVAAYSDYLKSPTSLAVPEFISADRIELARPGVTLWRDARESGLRPGLLTAGPDDLCALVYTSGTTGGAKGCMHTHRSTMHTLVSNMRWFALQPEMTLLAVAPFFHVTGMQGGMNGPLYNGNTVVILPRWDRDAAAQCVERYKVCGWTSVPAVVQDFFMNPNIGRYDLSSIRRLSGGGAAMPAAVAQRLADNGITYVEGYGLSETMAATHINPPHRPKMQCLGIPIFDVDSRVVDPVTLQELAAEEVGEIVIRGPQVFLGYWNRPEETAQVFVEIDGQRFLRTGDLGKVDAEGYFFMVDRLRRMINASGFKVWPSEVESQMYQWPAIAEACVIGARDERRGETVKAIVVLRAEFKGRINEQEVIDWCRRNMAAYKAPRIVEFVDALPKSGSGKIHWRELQDRENAASAAVAPS